MPEAKRVIDARQGKLVEIGSRRVVKSAPVPAPVTPRQPYYPERQRQEPRPKQVQREVEESESDEEPYRPPAIRVNSTVSQAPREQAGKAPAIDVKDDEVSKFARIGKDIKSVKELYDSDAYKKYGITTKIIIE